MSAPAEMTIFHGHIELLEILNKAGVRFLVIGGAAVRFYASERAPGDDIDVLVDKSLDNVRLSAGWPNAASTSPSRSCRSQRTEAPSVRRPERPRH